MAGEAPFRPDLNVKLVCPDCQTDPPDLEESASGDLVCADCGLVVGDRIVDTRSEWRTFANEEGDDPSRVGEASNPILDGLIESLDTRIGARDGGSGLSRQLQRTTQLGQGTQDRTILEAFDDIQRKCDSIQLSKVISDSAKQLFRRAEEDNIVKSRRTEATIAAAIHASCKINEVPRTLSEISSLTKVKKKVIGRISGRMQATFGLIAQGAQNAVAPTKALDLVGRFCSRLGLDQAIVRVTEDIVIRVSQAGVLAGKSPVTICAACILLAVTMSMADPPSVKAIAESVQITEATFKSAYNELLKERDRIVTTDLLQTHQGIAEAVRHGLSIVD